MYMAYEEGDINLIKEPRQLKNFNLSVELHISIANRFRTW